MERTKNPETEFIRAASAAMLDKAEKNLKTGKAVEWKNFEDAYCAAAGFSLVKQVTDGDWIELMTLAAMLWWQEQHPGSHYREVSSFQDILAAI